jgi:hypothetical protein
MPVLDRGTPTPPGTLVFVPHDGRELWAFPSRLIADAGLRHERFPELPVDPAQRTPRTASWVLVPCLVSLRDEFNRAGPNRSKASDGSIGDTAHASSSSDHNPDETGATPYEDSDRINEVHAIDVTDSGPWSSGFDFDAEVNAIRLRHQRGEDDRLQNIIRNGRIASRSWGWTWRDYSGSNPHDKHAHFSARYSTAQENDTSPWGVVGGASAEGEDDDMTTKEEFTKWLKDPDVRLALALAVHNTDGVVTAPEGAAPNPDGSPNTHWAAGTYYKSLYAATISGRGYAAEARTAGNALVPQVSALLAYAKAEAGEVPATAQQIAELVVAGLVDEPVAETAPAILALLGPMKTAALADALRALTAAK